MTGAPLYDEIELAIRDGAARPLRTRANEQRRKAADGTSSAGEKYPYVTIQTGEAVVAARLADEFGRIADEIEEGTVR